MPTAVLGHSSGEIAAAYAIGALSVESACRVAVYRGILAAKTSDAERRLGMMAVGLSEQEARSYLVNLGRRAKEQGVDVGFVSTVPTNVTLTGDAEQLDRLSVVLAKQSVFARKLDVNVAYHSQYMKTISKDYERLIGELEGPGPAGDTGLMYSSVTVSPVSVKELRTAKYWAKNLESPVLFAPCLSNT